MNRLSFKKVLDSINSCETKDQYISCANWIKQLRTLYNLGPKQNWKLNEYLLATGLKLNVNEWI